MLSRTLLSALAAGTASAVLIPPGLVATDLGDDNAMEISIDAMKRTVAVECPTCPFAVKEDSVLAWKQDAGSSFLLDFEVGDREDTLDINGVQLYPPSFGYFTEPFVVTQLDPASNENLQLRVTGYTFHYNSAETVSEAGIELLPMTFRITSIEGNPVDPPVLTINLLKDTNGRLMIASFSTAKAASSGSTAAATECKEWPLLCKWRGVLADRIKGIKSSMRKGCHMHKSNPATTEGNPMATETTEGKPAHRFRPGRPHHNAPHKQGHHAHHSHQRMHMFLHRAFFMVFVPILLGIFAGTLTYLIGMALGCVIAIVVAKVRGRAPYERVALAEDEEDVEPVFLVRHVDLDGEKEAYAEPPTYDAPPVYQEDLGEKEVVEQANKK